MASKFVGGGSKSGNNARPAPANPVKKTSTLVTKPGARSVPCGPCAAKKGRRNG